MTNDEFKKEFKYMYDSASNGAPDLNNYEISLVLTQAIRDIIDGLYSGFEFTEYNKRALNPLIKEYALTLTPSTDYFADIRATNGVLPSDLYYILQENVTLVNQEVNLVEVISEDLDYINKSLKNPFKKPNKRKVLRTQIGASTIRLYSVGAIDKFKIKYIKKYSPIILSDFTTDPDLLGSETIDGSSSISTTDLPVFMHDKIIKRAVVLAVKSLRENSLKTQIEV